MENKDKTCFIIMPISDQDGYEKGHFSRVYQHIIKPACEQAGFKPLRADDEIKTNYIVIDIIKKILESDMVICDLSAKNPNVLYELGIRQSFNKKVVLIKDNRTARIFDIQGLRTIDYDDNLRVDEVQKAIISISKSIKETYEQSEDDVNSLLQLLSIKPAELKNVEISQESSMIMDALNDISNRLYKIENSKRPEGTLINGDKVNIGDFLYEYNGKDYIDVGILEGFNDEYIFINDDGVTRKIKRGTDKYSKLTTFPF